MTNTNFTPLQAGTPRENRGGGTRGGSPKTRFYREQLQANPEKWFIWKSGTSHGSDTGQALRTLMGVQNLTGVDRSTLPYQATAQKQDDGTYTTFVRFVGVDNATASVEATPLADGEGTYVGTDEVVVEAASGVVSNPFGASV